MREKDPYSFYIQETHARENPIEIPERHIPMYSYQRLTHSHSSPSLLPLLTSILFKTLYPHSDSSFFVFIPFIRHSSTLTAFVLQFMH